MKAIKTIWRQGPWLAAGLAWLAAATALAHNVGAPADVPNLLCPVTTSERADPAYSTVHHGRRVYFCCDRCRKKFEADPAAYAAFLTPAPPAHDADTPTWASRAAQGHRRVIHFPIALLWAAGLAEWLATRGQRPGLAETSRFCANVAALGALVAVPLGLLAAGWPQGVSGALIDWHRGLGVATLAGCLLIAKLGQGVRPHPYRLALALGIANVTVTGHLGGLLIP